jgi:predicted nuclease with TOPRIM domain
MGRRRRQGNFIPQKNNNSIEDLVGNEENEYPVLDPNRIRINITNELNNVHKKKSLKEEIMDELIEIRMEKLQEIVKQNIQNDLKQYQDTTNKKLKNTQKQLSELREDFNKHQSETKETIKNKKEICEIKKTTQNMKEELNKDLENLRKKEPNRNPGN